MSIDSITIETINSIGITYSLQSDYTFIYSKSDSKDNDVINIDNP